LSTLAPHTGKRYQHSWLLFALLATVVTVSCGPGDYQQPVKQFQDASDVVIAATRTFLDHENTVEENAVIDRQVFEQKPLDPAAINAADIISPEEIKLRTDALDALAKYTANLGLLASGKAAAEVGQDTKTLSKSLEKLADDAKNVPGAQGTIFDNQKFSGIAGAAAGAIGAVAQLIIDRKARRELEHAVVANDPAVQNLLQLIADDATLAYERQKATLSATGFQMYNIYKEELQKPDRDPVLLLLMADRIKNFRTQQSVLPAADPAPAILAMKKAHSALVSSIESDKTPHGLSQLVEAVHDLATAAGPLGDAVQELVKAST